MLYCENCDRPFKNSGGFHTHKLHCIEKNDKQKIIDLYPIFTISLISNPDLVREYLQTLSLNMIAEYTPEDFERFFRIDFAILNKKIAIEVNGNQHYKRNGEFNEYHLERQQYIESKDWKVINIPAVNIKNNFEAIKLQLKSLLDDI